MTDQPENTYDAHIRQLNAYADDPDYLALRSYEDRAAFFETQVGRKWEIDAAIYDEFLNVLPPLAWRADSFLMSEFLFDGITHRYARADDRYFCEVVAWPPRPKPTAAVAPIRVQKAQPEG